MAAAEKTERRLTLEAAVQQFGTALTARDGARIRLIKRTAVRCPCIFSYCWQQCAMAHLLLFEGETTWESASSAPQSLLCRPSRQASQPWSRGRLTRLHVLRSRLAQLCPLTVEDLMKHTVPGLSRNAMNRWGASLVEALRQGDAHARSAADGSGLSSVSSVNQQVRQTMLDYSSSPVWPGSNLISNVSWYHDGGFDMALLPHI